MFQSFVGLNSPRSSPHSQLIRRTHTTHRIWTGWTMAMGGGEEGIWSFVPSELPSIPRIIKQSQWLVSASGHDDLVSRFAVKEDRGYNSELTRASKRGISLCVVCGDNITEFIATEPQNWRSVLGWRGEQLEAEVQMRQRMGEGRWIFKFIGDSVISIWFESLPLHVLRCRDSWEPPPT